VHIYDIPKPVSQGEFGSLHTANSRMEKITDVLRRKTTCSIHDEKLQACTEADKGLLWKEQRIAEQIAKVNNCWYPIDEVFNIGAMGPSGSENDTYISLKFGEIYKVNNLTHCGLLSDYFQRLIWHNQLFYETMYEFVGFTGFEQRSVFPIVKQQLIDNFPATADLIEAHLQNLGFKKTINNHWFNETFEIWDVVPKNAMTDINGTIYVIDAEIRKL
jgi:hypothetical protein